MTTIVNLTPHDVVLINGEQKQIFPRTGTIARVSTEVTEIDLTYKYCKKDLIKDLKDIKFVSTDVGEVINLPDESKNEYGDYLRLYIVSAIVKSSCQERGDLIVPADLVRDEKGNIIGCRAFSF